VPGFRNRAIRNHHDEHQGMEANAAAMDSLFFSQTCLMCFRKSQDSSKMQHKAVERETKEESSTPPPLFWHFEFTF